MNKINFNEGQTAVFLKDLTGKEYPAIAEVKRNKRVNGQREITLSFLYTDINKDFMEKLEFGWKVLFKGEEYTITHTGSATDGKYMLIDVTAILSFFVELNGYYLQDSVEDKSSTAPNYFNNIFQGTPFTYVLVDHLEATTLNYEDNQSKTQRFLYGIDRYEAEYKVQGKVAYIHKTVGHDKDVILHEDLNVNSVRIDVDASGFHTWAKGYGDLDEETGEYKLEVEYISPLAEKYGMIEGPAIKDGNFKHADALTEAVKKQVENSYIVSTEIHAVDLTNNGYPEMILEEGDRVWLVVNRLNLNQQVRVMEIEETFDWEGNIIDAVYTVGNEGIASRYKTQQYDSIRDFRDITTGRKKLEYNWLPDAVRRASEIINGNQDSLFKYGAGEIIGINQSNPNGYMRFNTDGIGFSRDGGKTYQTAITYEGIVADAITAGTLRGIVIEGVEIYQRSGNRGLDMIEGVLYSYYNDYLAMSFGQYKLNFFNRSGGRIGFFGPTTLSGDSDTSGLSMIVDQDYFSISLPSIDGNYAPSFRTSSTSRSTVVSGAYGTGSDGSELGLFANASRTFGGLRTDQPSLLLQEGYERNDAFLYFGGVNRRNNAVFEVRWNNAADSFVTRARFTSSGVELNGTVKGSGSDGHIVGPGGNRYYENATGSYNLYQLNSLKANGITTASSDGFYLGTRNGGSLHVTNFNGYNDGNGITYRPVNASEFNNSSSILLKTNIEDLEVSGLEVIRNLEVKQYILQDDVDNGIYDNWQVGVISEVSPEIASRDGLSVNHNKWLGYLTKAQQEELSERMKLEKRVGDLELMMEVMLNGAETN